jgi:hypothetical protein
MKNRLFPKTVFCLAVILFLALPMHNSAHAGGGVVGKSYLTFLFLQDDFTLELFTFDSDGTFGMMKRSEGTGTYSYFAPMFEVEWMSTDGDTAYNFTGISIAGIVIIGWDGTPSPAFSDACDSVFFVGIESKIFPD